MMLPVPLAGHQAYRCRIFTAQSLEALRSWTVNASGFSKIAVVEHLELLRWL